MIRETDIPCADCDDELEERTVRAGELSVQTAYRGPIDVAECPCCGARYYPERALGRLLDGSGVQRTQTDATAPECNE